MKTVVTAFLLIAVVACGTPQNTYQPQKGGTTTWEWRTVILIGETDQPETIILEGETTATAHTNTTTGETVLTDLVTSLRDLPEPGLEPGVTVKWETRTLPDGTVTELTGPDNTPLDLSLGIRVLLGPRHIVTQPTINATTWTTGHRLHIGDRFTLRWVTDHTRTIDQGNNHLVKYTQTIGEYTPTDPDSNPTVNVGTGTAEGEATIEDGRIRQLTENYHTTQTNTYTNGLTETVTINVETVWTLK